MISDSVLESVERTSRNSAILMVLGALIVGGALWFATARLASIQAQVKALESREQMLITKNQDLERSASELKQTAGDLNDQVSRLRQALSASRDAIAAFHAHNYAAAVSLYDIALAADPGNAYLLNLKAYSLFKLGRVSDAIATQQQGIKADPNYAWGFFDLARFQCAAGEKASAAESLRTAQGKEDRFRELAAEDGEFRHLCGSL
jgi:tetratricopeptide (TPR) repeat protein